METEFGPAPNQCNHSPYRTDTRSVGTRSERERDGGRWRDRRRYLKRKKQHEEALAGRLHPSHLVLQPFYWPWWAFWLVSNKGWFKKQPYLEEIPEVVWGGGGGWGCGGVLSHTDKPAPPSPTPPPLVDGSKYLLEFTSAGSSTAVYTQPATLELEPQRTKGFS